MLRSYYTMVRNRMRQKKVYVSKRYMHAYTHAPCVCNEHEDRTEQNPNLLLWFCVCVRQCVVRCNAIDFEIACKQKLQRSIISSIGKSFNFFRLCNENFSSFILKKNTILFSKKMNEKKSELYLNSSIDTPMTM